MYRNSQHRNSQHRNSRTRRSIRAASGLLAVIGASSLALTAQAQTYTLTDLGTLGGSQSFATGVNNGGQVVGNSLTGGGTTHGFITGAGGSSLKDLGTTVNSLSHITGEPGTTIGTNSYALGVNNKGQVAGYVSGGEAGDGLGFVSAPNGGTLQTLNLNFNPSRIVDVNNKGQVTGAREGGGAFFYDPSVADSYSDIDNFSGVALNSSGQVVGNVSTRPEGSLWDPNSGSTNYVSALGPGLYHPAFDINDRGQVVGSSENRDKFEEQHAYLTGPNGSGPSIDLGTLVTDVNPNNDFTFSQAHGLNNKDQVVGTSDIAEGSNVEHAFLWQNGVMTDLNSLVGPELGFTLTDATAISDSGFIVGNGLDAEGNIHAFLLSPPAVPEASSVVSLGLLLLLGAGGLAVRRRRAAPKPA